MIEIRNRAFIKFLITNESNEIVLMIAIEPITRAIFAVFDPIAFPIARLDSAAKADIYETKISGAEVANATIVKPITIVGIFMFFATEVAPSTKKCDPMINSKNPIVKYARNVIIKFSIISF